MLVKICNGTNILKTKDITGVITLVQEHRFRVCDELGRNRLFILTRDAKQEWSDLVTLEQSGSLVSVRYTENASLIACSAHAVSTLAQ